MLHYVITFFLLAILAGYLGFGGLASDFAGVAQLLTVVFVILLLASIVHKVVTGRNINPPL